MMKRRMLAGGMAVVLSLMVMVSPALAVENTPADSTDKEVIEDPLTSETTPPEGETETGEETPVTPPDQDTQAPETPESPATPEEPEDTTPDQSLPEGIALRQDHVAYMAGFPGGTFQPETQLTRAQAAQILYRLLADPDSGTGDCGYTDVADSDWFAQPARALCALGIFDNGAFFRPNDVITRAEFVALLLRVNPQEGGTATFPDVPATHWAAQAIGAAAAQGWIGGYPDGTFRPENGLTRAEACAVLNRMLGRTGDSAQANKLMTLGLFADVPASHWAATTIAEAAVQHTPVDNGSGETWTGVDLTQMTFQAGVHQVDGQLYCVDRNGNLAVNQVVGAYTAGSDGALVQTATFYQLPYVPYISQIDNIYAWVGCEAVSTLMGLQAKGYATDVSVKYFLDNLPRHSSNPEKGFVGSPYVPDTSKRTRTTIYPAKLAEYSNSYCNGDVVCADFRGASITDLQRELLAGNCVVAYMTLWWEAPYYRYYNIEGTTQRLVSNNHAVLVYGYDPERGYLISDPYNYYNRGEVYQYWENAQTFERIWNERQTGMVIR